MKIRKNSLVDVVVKVLMVLSFMMIFAQPQFSVLGIGLYLSNLTFLWVLATIETYYITEGGK